MTAEAGLSPEPRGLTLRTTAVVVAAYERVSAISGRTRPPVTPVDRDLSVRVVEIRHEADGVRSLLLAADTELPPWDPGAHVDVVLPSGRLRQYSLTGDPDDLGHYRIAVRRIADGGGGSLEVHGLKVGQELVLKGPRNAFPFIDVPAYHFVAGGIGITPILPMLRDVVRHDADWMFVYTGRDRASMPFLDEITELAARFPERVHIWPDDEYGEPDGARILSVAPHGAALYTCGPPPMIDAIRALVPAEQIETLHYERFSAPPVVGGEPFTIRLERSGRVIEVGADETALAALRSTLPDLPYSCQQGFCGTCPVALVAGEVDHRDKCLTAEQRVGQFAVCVSRGGGELVLDL